MRAAGTTSPLRQARTGPDLVHGLATLSAAVTAVQLIDLQASAALSGQPPAPPRDGFSALFDAELRNAVRSGAAGNAFGAAEALWRRTGDLTRVYRVLGAVLAAVAADRLHGAVTLVQERRAVAAAASVIARLRAMTLTPDGSGPVLVTAPPADRTGLALEMLAHLVEDGGLSTVVLADASAADLVEATRESPVTAVLVSVQTAAGAGTLRPFLATVQQGAPQVPLLITGSAAPSVATPGTVLSPELSVLLASLTRSVSPLTARETRVLECVAAGLTNAEVAAQLGVATATVKTHLDNVFDKTGTQHRAAAVATALRSGWLR